MNAAVKEKGQLSLFVKRELDNYGLDPYEFRIYARITRRPENGEAWASLDNITSAYRMTLSRARKTLRLLNLAEITQ